MAQQHTLKRAVSFAGIGLHSGNRVTMTFQPAPPDSGLRFRRVDLDGKPEIEALAEHIIETNRSTSLAKGNVRIQTVEHVLAALSGAGVDNAVIELDANEPPIADGSSREYARMIDSAGLAQQTSTREPYAVTDMIKLEMGDTMMTAFPHDGLKLTCTSADKAGRFTQYYSLEVTPETWRKELSQARTFCFYEEIEHLYKNGLIKGGSLENAVVIRDDAVLTTEPLRYAEEFVRHKMLDMLGDLALLGQPLKAHIVAVKPGHGPNCELVRAILAQKKKPLVAAQTFTPPPPPPEKAAAPKAAASPEPAAAGTESLVRDGATLDVIQVMKVLPHRHPFLMVEKVTKIEGNHIVGLKNVSIGEPYFEGHFPGHPIMPGVLQLEAMAQVAGILMMRQAENAGKLAYFMSAESVKWRRPVRPGDTLIIDVEVTKMRGKIGKAKGTCRVDNEVVSEAEVTFMLIDR
ncbi:MAG: UDP-3-O-acyl-N-acetylglucosamine deacetylase [Verrucomicrobia bacterium]|nr:UDP-3-O-acyl-N-acetylglucosamine deacetylase [Verrucomicrobiota bacterium]